MKKIIIVLTAGVLIVLAAIGLLQNNKYSLPEPANVTIKDVYPGFQFFATVLKSDGSLWAWGENMYGQLGDGTREQKDSPVKVQHINNVTSVSAGHDHILALKRDGEVFEWGRNYGYGLTAPRDVNGERNESEGEKLYKRHFPTIVKGLRDLSISNVIVQYINALKRGQWFWPWETSGYIPGISMIAACGQYSLALKDDGTVWGWGRNVDGALGKDVTTTKANTIIPVQIAGLSDIIALDCGSGHSLALKRDGTVWAWGTNDSHLLGVDTVSATHIPVQVPGLGGIVALSAGNNHNLVLDSNDAVWGWGDNRVSQINSSADKLITVPVRLDQIGNVQSLAACGVSSFALLKDGTIWTWGQNIGQTFGDSEQRVSYPRMPYPTQVIGLEDMIGMKCRQGYALALKRDGTVWEWGGTSRWREYAAWEGHPEYKGRSRVVITQPSQVEGL